MTIIIEETISEICKVIEIKILEMNMEEIIEMTVLEEVEVGLQTDNTSGNSR